MFDELCAIDRSDEQIHGIPRRTRAIVHRAAKGALHDRPVNLPHIARRSLILHAHHYAVRMKEVRNGRPLAKELWIRHDAKRQAALPILGCERAAQFQSSARRHRALFDHQLRRSRFGGNLTRHVVDRGEIRIAVFLWRCADANEDGIAAAYRFASVRGVRDLAGPSRRSQDLVQVLLKDRYASRLEPRDPLLINVRKNDLMPRFGETCAGHQANITTSNYRETQSSPPRRDSLCSHIPMCSSSSVARCSSPIAARAAPAVRVAAGAAARSTAAASTRRA